MHYLTFLIIQIFALRNMLGKKYRNVVKDEKR